MWLSASKVVVLTGLSMAALFLGLATPLHAQDATEETDADLRLETETDLDLAIEEPAPTPITIGDDNAEQPRRPRAPAIGPYDPLGLRLGAFTVFPTLEIGTGVSVDHSDATGTDTRIVTRVRPTLRAESDWSRHQLTIDGSAELDYEFGGTDVLSLQGDLEAGLRLDVRRGTTADLSVRYQALKADVSSPDSAVEHNLTNAVALTHDLGGIEARVRAAASRTVFEDSELAGGGTQDNGDRAFTELSLALRGSLTRDAVITPFAEVAYDTRLYDQKIDRNGFARSSQGLRLSAGVAISDDPIWSGEVAANLLYRTYDDSSLDDAFAPGLSAAITWRPTDLTRFEFNADASLAETITAGESATARWSAGYTVTHDLRENLSVSAGMSLTKEAGGTDTLTLGTDLGLSWALNRNVVLGLNYSGDYINSTTDRQDHSLIGSIILRR